LFAGITGLPAADIQQLVLKKGAHQFVPVSRITSEQLNIKFIESIRILTQQRAVLADFDRRLAAVLNFQEKTRLQEERAALAKRVDENNSFLINKFAYSMNRNFTMVIEDSHLYRQTSNEELTELKVHYPDHDWDNSVRHDNGKIYVFTKEIPGVESNNTFQSYADAVRAQIAQKEKYQETMTQVTAGTSRDYPGQAERDAFTTWYYQMLDTIEANEKHLIDNYSVSVGSGFIRVVINTKLYAEVTDEELRRLPVEGLSILYR